MMLMLAYGRNAIQTACSYLRAYKAPHAGLQQHKLLAKKRHNRAIFDKKRSKTNKINHIFLSPRTTF